MKNTESVVHCEPELRKTGNFMERLVYLKKLSETKLLIDSVTKILSMLLYGYLASILNLYAVFLIHLINSASLWEVPQKAHHFLLKCANQIEMSQ